jgi:hypothetical protein
MYNGRLIDELTAMVARAEMHAHEVELEAAVAEEPQAYCFTPQYAFDATQPALIGVA